MTTVACSVDRSMAVTVVEEIMFACSIVPIFPCSLNMDAHPLKLARAMKLRVFN